MNRTIRLTLTVILVAAALTPANAQRPAGDPAPRLAQAALLEATRQDMVTYRLAQLSAGFRDLIRDVESNGVDDPQLNQDLAALAERLAVLEHRWVDQVKATLDAAADGQTDAASQIIQARQDIRHIVRKLAVLLLEAGVRHATQVTATRLDDITEQHIQLMDSTGSASAQTALAEELDELLDELRALTHPLAQPLAAVRLARVRKLIEQPQAPAKMRQAGRALAEQQTDAASRAQAAALDALQQARQKLREQEEADHRKQLRARRLAAAQRLDQLRVAQDRQLDFIGRIEMLAPEDPEYQRLMADQRRLLADLESFVDTLGADDPWTPSIRGPVNRAAARVRAAIMAFEAGDADNALRDSRSVIAALRMGAKRVEQKVDVLEGVEVHLELAEDMTYVSGFLADVEQEQRDIQAKAPHAPAGQTQRVVAAAVDELGEAVAGVPEAALVVELMTEARSSMTQLIQTQTLPAEQVTQLREQSAKSVGDAGQQAQALAARAAYVAQWLEYLGAQQADLLSLLARQIALREQTEREAQQRFGELKGEQDILLGETEAYAQTMEIGQADYVEAAGHMRLAMVKLDEVDRDRAVHHQRQAEAALTAAAQALSDLLGRVEQIIAMERMQAYEAEVHILSQVMMLAVQQRHIRYRAREASEAHLVKFTAREQEHLQRVTFSVATDERVPSVEGLGAALNAAAGQMGEATIDLKNTRRDEALAHQREAEKQLRIVIGELVGTLVQLLDDVFAEAQGGGGDSWDISAASPMEAVRIFGEAPVGPQHGLKISRSTWEPLNARERAALSENFARELPLEYRAALKAYYRSLAE